MKAVRSVRVGLAVLVISVVAVLAGPVSPSSAHAELISSTPADGATLAAVPPTVSLTFTDEIDGQFVRAALTTPAGMATVETATAHLQTVTVPIQPAGPGAYKLVYRVVSADGHPISGQLRFTVSGTPTAAPSAGGASVSASPAQAAANPAETSPSASAASAEGGSGGGGGSWMIWAAVALAVVAGGGAVVAATRGRRS